MNILRIALCDLRRLFKDPMVFFWWLAMPLGFIFLFGSFTGNYTNRKVWLPVVNLDKQELSHIFVEQLKSEKFAVDIRPATDEMNTRYWSRAVILPATFSTDLLAGKQVRFSFLKHSHDDDREGTLAVQARVIHTLVKFIGAAAAVDVINQGWTQNTRQAFLNELAKPQQLRIETAAHTTLRPPPVGFAFSLPSYLVMFLFINTIMSGGITLVADRKGRQLMRLLSTPVSPTEIFAGKMLGRVIQPLLQSSLLILLGYFLFKVPLGDHPLVLFPVLLSLAAFCGCISLFFGTFCATEQQIHSLGILSTMVLCALGGCMWPLEIVPATFKLVAMFTPTYWGLEGLHKVMSFGKTWSDVIPECGILLGFSAGFYLLALMAFNRAKQI